MCYHSNKSKIKKVSHKEGVYLVNKEQRTILSCKALCQKDLEECTWLTGKGGLH